MKRSDTFTEKSCWSWCRVHNAMVRFESNQTASVKVNGISRRRTTFVEAVSALRFAIEDCD